MGDVVTGPRPLDPAAPGSPDPAAVPRLPAAGEASSTGVDHSAGAEPPTAPVIAPVLASPVERDWLSSVCPYLQSEDGSYHASEPDPAHRCAAQDPPGSLPLAFQERFCLTERHPRCEMYKYAQESGGAGPVPGATIPGATSGPRFVALSRALDSSGGDGSRRPLLAAAGGIGGVILIVLLVLLMSSCFGGSGTPGPSAEPTAAAQASGEPTRAPGPTSPDAPDATPTPEATADELVDATAAPEGEALLILYEVQEGEALLKIADAFGTTRRDILLANEGMQDSKPYVQTGQVIIVPVSPGLSIEEIESVPGYQGLAP